MKKYLFVCFLYFIGISPLFAQSLERIAVLQIQNKTDIKSEEAAFLTSQIQQKIQLKAVGKYQVMTQENILALLPPNQSLEDCTLTECEVNTGRMLGAHLIVTGQLLKFGNRKDSLRLTIKLHETKTGNLLLSHTMRGSHANDLERELEANIDTMIESAIKSLAIYEQSQVNPIEPQLNNQPLEKALTMTSNVNEYQEQILKEWSFIIANTLFDDPQLPTLLSQFLKLYEHHPFTQPFGTLIQQTLIALEKKQYPQSHLIKWVSVPAGHFYMGFHKDLKKDLPKDLQNLLPWHEVRLKGFYMSESEVTFAQYTQCVNAGVCQPPSIHDLSCYIYYNAKSYGAQYQYTSAVHHDADIKIKAFKKELPPEFTQSKNQPVVCITWQQARSFAQWVGGDLPTEAQWEYAAKAILPRGTKAQLRESLNAQKQLNQRSKIIYRTDRGETALIDASNDEEEMVEVLEEEEIIFDQENEQDQLQKQKEEISDKENTDEINDDYQYIVLPGVTNQDSTQESCSLQKESEHDWSDLDFCDLIGNVWEWVLDEYHVQGNAPQNGQAWCHNSACSHQNGIQRVYRGGSWLINDSPQYHVLRRANAYPNAKSNHLGFRVVLNPKWGDIQSK